MSSPLYTMKRVVEYGFNAAALRQLKRRRSRRIFLFLSPQYLNYGDHAIAVAELDFLREMFPAYEVLDVNYSLFRYWPEEVRAAVRPDDFVVVTGGGFMGNLWPDNQKLTEKIIELFPRNRIIFAPQTLFFQQTEQAEAEKKRFKGLLENHGNFFFFARDEATCVQMEQLGFQRDKDFAGMPDFVLFLRDIPALKLKRGRPVLCLRSDGEAAIDARRVEQLVVSASHCSPKKVIMAKDHVEIPTCVRDAFVKHKLRQYAGADFVVTDRLHTMIFSAYTGTPCFAFDNVSRKVSGVYQWIAPLEYIKIAGDLSQLPGLISRVPAASKGENREEFLKLQRQLKKRYLPAFLAQFR